MLLTKFSLLAQYSILFIDRLLDVRQRLMTLLLVVVLFYLPQNCLWPALVIIYLVQPQASVVVQLRIKMAHVELVLWDVLVVGLRCELSLAYWNSVDVKWTGIILCAGVVHV